MKNELLTYISNMTGYLVIKTRIINASNSEVVTNEAVCSMKIKVPKERTGVIISTCFNDELIGSMPGSSIQHQITSWSVE